MRLAVAIALDRALSTGCGGRRGIAGRPTPGPAGVPTATAAPATVHPTVQIAGIVAPYQNVSISSSLSEPTDSVGVVEGDVRPARSASWRCSTRPICARASRPRSAAPTPRYARVSTDAVSGGAQHRPGQRSGAQRPGGAAASAADARPRSKELDALSGALEQRIRLAAASRPAAHDGAQRPAASALDASDACSPRRSTRRSTAAISKDCRPRTSRRRRRTPPRRTRRPTQIQAQIDKAVIISPVDGVVVNRNLNPGEYPGSRTIFTVQQLDPVYAELNASSEDVFRIRRGAAVSVTVAGRQRGALSRPSQRGARPGAARLDELYGRGDPRESPVPA